MSGVYFIDSTVVSSTKGSILYLSTCSFVSEEILLGAHAEGLFHVFRRSFKSRLLVCCWSD